MIHDDSVSDERGQPTRAAPAELENCLSVNDGVRGIGGPGAPGPQFQGDPELYHTFIPLSS